MKILPPPLLSTTWEKISDCSQFRWLWKKTSIRDLCGWTTGDDIPAFPSQGRRSPSAVALASARHPWLRVDAITTAGTTISQTSESRHPSGRDGRSASRFMACPVRQARSVFQDAPWGLSGCTVGGGIGPSAEHCARILWLALGIRVGWRRDPRLRSPPLASISRSEVRGRRATREPLHRVPSTYRGRRRPAPHAADGRAR